MVLIRVGPSKNGYASIAGIADEKAPGVLDDGAEAAKYSIEQVLGVIWIVAGDLPVESTVSTARMLMMALSGEAASTIMTCLTWPPRRL